MTVERKVQIGIAWLNTHEGDSKQQRRQIKGAPTDVSFLWLFPDRQTEQLCD